MVVIVNSDESAWAEGSTEAASAADPVQPAPTVTSHWDHVSITAVQHRMICRGSSCGMVTLTPGRTYLFVDSSSRNHEQLTPVAICTMTNVLTPTGGSVKFFACDCSGISAGHDHGIVLRTQRSRIARGMPECAVEHSV